MPETKESPFTVARRRAALRRHFALSDASDNDDEAEVDEMLNRAADRALETTYSAASTRRSARR
jgi:hypothetical protein